MTDDRAWLTRRSLLAVAGSGLLAGCRSASESDETTSDRLADLVSGPTPTINDDDFPMAVEDSYVDRQVDRTRSLLSAVPLPLDERDIPNGTVREILQDNADYAREAIERAREAPSRRKALQRLRDARESAQAVRTAWIAINDGMSVETVSDEIEALYDRYRSFRDRWTYVGDDPIRALRVHATIEGLVRTVRLDAADLREELPASGQSVNVVSFGGFGETLEGIRAVLDDAVYTFDRFRRELSTPQDFGDRFRSFVGTINEYHDEARPDIDYESFEAMVEDLGVGDPVLYPFVEFYTGDTGLPASITRDRPENSAGITASILGTYRELLRLRAFGTLRDRIENGRRYTVESVSDVASIRTRAIESLETAGDQLTYPVLSRPMLADMAATVALADEQIADRIANDDSWIAQEDSVFDQIDRYVGWYIHATAVSTVLPTVSETIGAELMD